MLTIDFFTISAASLTPKVPPMSAVVAVRAVVARHVGWHASSSLPRLRRLRGHVSWSSPTATARVWARAAATSAAPPPTLDPADERFNTEVSVLALRAPRREIGGLMLSLRKHTLCRPRTHKVVHLGDGADESSLILLDEKTCAPGCDVGALPEAVRKVLLSTGVDRVDMSDTDLDTSVDREHARVDTPRVTLISHTLVLRYDNLSAEECLSKLLPSDVTVPTGFETAGTIAHLNLRDEHMCHKHVIGAVLLDKLPNIKTVVTKIGETGGPFRTFKMEVIAGEGGHLTGPLITSVSENGLTYQLDFRNMYWNSRLGTERMRLVDSFSEHDVVLDLCAGVGPIALPALKKAKKVYANDLNPDAVAFLKKNDSRNKKQNGGKTLSWIGSMNARECVLHMVNGVGSMGTADTSVQSESSRKQSLGDSGDNSSVNPSDAGQSLPRFTQAVMNLPEGGVDLLSCFVGVFNETHWSRESLPQINVYAFSKSDDPERDVSTRAAESLGLGPNADALGAVGVYSRRVRNVAPGKYMMLLSFQLPAEAAYSSIDSMEK